MNKVAIVTGGSRGIGAATALLLAEHGYAVCVNYNNAIEDANNIVASIKSKNGMAFAHQADIASEKEIMALFEKVDQEFGPVSALVNNAGINGGICEVEHITAASLQSVFATNVFGSMISCREAVKRMKKMSGGSIVNISSETAKFGGTNLTHYAASKAAINTFTVGFAREVAPFNIRVNAVSPGVIDTEMHHTSPPARVANLVKTIPMGRMGTPKEVAEMIVWLLSNQASYVSGAIIPITGSR